MAARLTLSHAQKIIQASFDKASELRLKPLSVAVLDAGGNLIAFQRQDGSSNKRFEIARGKAAGALALGMSSRAVAGIAAERPSFIASIGAILPDGVIPAAGGVLVAGDDGLPIGAVGATGDTSDNDEACVLEGIKAAGLAAKT
ncbi:MAG TPA: heme-binding protein [Rhizomicrobium sp.]|nr:heme-binding protein [Rhizomicrobium sp.]